MTRRTDIFDDNWIKRTKATAGSNSWAHDALRTLDTTGGVYLSSIRLWFNQYPLQSKQKQALAARLESTKDEDHLGAVNELVWWPFFARKNSTSIPCLRPHRPRRISWSRLLRNSLSKCQRSPYLLEINPSLTQEIQLNSTIAKHYDESWESSQTRK